jgi:hypothetical protein
MPDLVVSDIAALAIASAIEKQTLADALNNKLLIAANEKLFGTLANEASASGITAQVSRAVLSLNDIRNKLQAQADSAKAMETLIGNLTAAIETQTKALANIQSTQIKRLQTEQVVAVDALKANQHHQAVVADSRNDQGKPPIVITPEQKKAAFEESQNAIIDLRASQGLQTLIEEYLSEAYAEGKKIALVWYADSAIDKWVTQNWGKVKAQVAILFGPKKVKETLETTQTSLFQAKLDPKSAAIPTTVEA